MIFGIIQIISTESNSKIMNKIYQISEHYVTLLYDENPIIRSKTLECIEFLTSHNRHDLLLLLPLPTPKTTEECEVKGRENFLSSLHVLSILSKNISLMCFHFVQCWNK
jgi:hypothetical protein